MVTTTNLNLVGIATIKEPMKEYRIKVFSIISVDEKGKYKVKVVFNHIFYSYTNVSAISLSTRFVKVLCKDFKTKLGFEVSTSSNAEFRKEAQGLFKLYPMLTSMFVDCTSERSIYVDYEG